MSWRADNPSPPSPPPGRRGRRAAPVPPPVPISDAAAMDLARRALKLVCAALPYLTGLAHAVRIVAERRIPTAAVWPSGRIGLNPDWFGRLDLPDAAFVIAHELLHLCLRTHDRASHEDAHLFNWAHDYIINDILAYELNRAVPAGGLARPGSRHESAELLVRWMKEGRLPAPRREMLNAMQAALVEAGLARRADLDDSTDVRSQASERSLFPTDSPEELARLARAVQIQGARSASLEHLRPLLGGDGGRDGASAGAQDAAVQALRAAYAPPWELALQQWMEGSVPAGRTFARHSRRGEGAGGAVRPGHNRIGWALHIVLDTSGSMHDAFRRVLGLIASFCEGAQVADIHLLQCDQAVTRDQWIRPEELDDFAISGLGGSDLSPALRQLARDPEVQAVLILTDGQIDYPREPMPYRTLWAIVPPRYADEFDPPYGQVLAVTT